MSSSTEAKSQWLKDAKVRIPVGTRVRVVRSDVEEYVGATGVVADYDLGYDADEWPLVGVIFDKPVSHSESAKPSTRDGFYCDGDSDDEIVPLAE